MAWCIRHSPYAQTRQVNRVSRAGPARCHRGHAAPAAAVGGQARARSAGGPQYRLARCQPAVRDRSSTAAAPDRPWRCGPGDPGVTHSAGTPGLTRPPEQSAPDPLEGGHGPVERLMSTLIRKLAWSRLSNPRVAVSLSAAGLLLGMLLGATAPNAETLPVLLPLSRLLPSLSSQHVLASLMLYTGDILACLGLAGMLWAHSQGWRPNPRILLLVSTGIVGSWSASPRWAPPTPRATRPTAGSPRWAVTRTPPTRSPSSAATPPTPQVVGDHVEGAAVGLRPVRHGDPVVRGLDRPRERRDHDLGAR